jgi:ABC-type hemin transport system substrate-binding protein
MPDHPVLELSPAELLAEHGIGPADVILRQRAAEVFTDNFLDGDPSGEVIVNADELAETVGAIFGDPEVLRYIAEGAQ